MESYIIHKDTMSIEEWLPMELQVNLQRSQMRD